MAVRIGELLLKEQRITAAQLEEALEHQKSNGGKLGYNLVKLGFAKDEEIASLLSRQYGVPSINLSQFDIDADVIKVVPAATAQKYEIVPVSRVGATLTIAMSDPTNVFAVDDIKFMTGYHVEPVVASQTAIVEAIDRYYGNGDGAAEKNVSESQMELASKALEERPQVSDDDVQVLEEMEEVDVLSFEKQGGEAPVVRLVNVVLASAIRSGWTFRRHRAGSSRTKARSSRSCGTSPPTGFGRCPMAAPWCSRSGPRRWAPSHSACATRVSGFRPASSTACCSRSTGHSHRAQVWDSRLCTGS